MSRSKLKTKKLFIDDIPVLEIYLQELKDRSAPLLVFYHGWTSDKINGSGFGESIAKFGFRVVVPDCNYHGAQAEKNLQMWDVHYLFRSVVETAADFPKIIEYYQKRNLIADNFYAVAGVSMGGMIANVLLGKYADIKAAGVLMGSPQLENFAKWIIYGGLEDLLYASKEFYPDIILPDERLRQGIINRETDLLLELLPELAVWDLSKKPWAINGRPVCYWHAEPDPIMPYRFTVDFYNSIQKLPEAKHVFLKSDAEGSHMVPLIETKRLAQFIWNSYQILTFNGNGFSKDELWLLTNEQIERKRRNNF